MVQTLERPAETIEATYERPEGRSIIYGTRLFLDKYGDLMTEVHGVVAQQSVNYNTITHTVFLDTRQSAQYSWRLTSSYVRAGRAVTDITVDNEAKVSAWHALYDGMGRLSSAAEISEWQPKWQLISDILKSEKTRVDIARLFKTRQELEQALAILLINRQVKNSYRIKDVDVVGPNAKCDSDNDGNLIVLRDKKLDDAELAKAIESTEANINKVGFVALKTTPKPEIYSPISESNSVTLLSLLG